MLQLAFAKVLFANKLFLVVFFLLAFAGCIWLIVNGMRQAKRAVREESREDLTHEHEHRLRQKEANIRLNNLDKQNK